MRFHLLLAILLFSSPVFAADNKPKTLTPEEFAAGWVSLFDGETVYGWTIDGVSQIKDGNLVVGTGKATTMRPTAEFGPDCEYEMELRGGTVIAGDRVVNLEATPAAGKEWGKLTVRFTSGMMTASCTQINSESVRGENRPFQIRTDPTNPMTLHSIKARPTKTIAMFNGKDLTGWKRFTGEPKRELSKFEVTKAGEIHLTNGAGDLQTEAEFKDFCLQLECKTNGKALNSGIFFRCLPGQYQQGYEAQIHNGFKDNDRTKPTDFGTGAIYRRTPARMVVANDEEWFSMTVLAFGQRLRTWVNGYPTVDWLDERPANANARNGKKLDAGRISIQGHDPTTDILFRNLRIAKIPDLPAK